MDYKNYLILLLSTLCFYYKFRKYRVRTTSTEGKCESCGKAIKLVTKEKTIGEL